MSDYIEYTVKFFNSGTKCWYLNDKRHREDGPAEEWADGTKFWYLNDKPHREEEFNKRTNKPCVSKVVTIEGVEYKLVPTSKGSKIRSYLNKLIASI